MSLRNTLIIIGAVTVGLSVVVGTFAFITQPQHIPTPDEIRAREEVVEAEHRRQIERIEAKAKAEAEKSEAEKTSENVGEAVVGTAGILGTVWLLGQLAK